MRYLSPVLHHQVHVNHKREHDGQTLGAFLLGKVVGQQKLQKLLKLQTTDFKLQSTDPGVFDHSFRTIALEIGSRVHHREQLVQRGYQSNQMVD